MSSSNKSIKIVILGDLAVGKTCFLVSYTKNEFRAQYKPTEFDNYHTKLMVEKQEIELNFVDCSGKEVDNLRSISFDHTDIFILMFAINQRDSFINCKGKWMNEMSKCQNESLCFLLIGTKCDIKDDTNCVSQNEIDQFVQDCSLCIAYMETSALTQVGVKESVEKAVRYILFPSNTDSPCCCCVLL